MLMLYNRKFAGSTARSFTNRELQFQRLVIPWAYSYYAGLFLENSNDVALSRKYGRNCKPNACRR
jgi:hypothetical protein